MTIEENALEPLEAPTTEIATVLQEGDPETQLITLEKKAELAPRMRAAINTILMTQTFASDWNEQGGKYCLSSAGAERVATLFDISFYDTVGKKEEFNDAHGKGYRYVFEGKARHCNRVVFVQGSYSTRDKFLGFKGGEWRPVEDINEGNIRNAAYHIYIGNGVKALLGLRSIPVDEWKNIMKGAGKDTSKASTVKRGAGTQGGTTKDDLPKQQELAELCIKIADSGSFPFHNEDGSWELVKGAPSDLQGLEGMGLAKAVCEEISSFKNKEGKVVAGKPASKLKGKWLNISLKTAQEIAKGLDK